MTGSSKVKESTHLYNEQMKRIASWISTCRAAVKEAAADDLPTASKLAAGKVPLYVCFWFGLDNTLGAVFRPVWSISPFKADSVLKILSFADVNAHFKIQASNLARTNLCKTNLQLRPNLLLRA